MHRSQLSNQTVAIIPARGGSKGLPGKNIRMLAGKPLIAYSIESALRSTSIGSVYVSTNDSEIAAVARDFGAQVIYRPDLIAGDSASSESALLHGVEYLNAKDVHPEYIVFLQCTSPLRGNEDIDCAMAELTNNKADSLLSVSPSHRFLWEISEGVPRSINYNWQDRPRRQDMNPQYVENGSIYIFKPSVLMSYNNRLGGKVAMYVMQENQSFEIDSLSDFEYVEWIIQKSSNKQCTK